MKNSRQFKTSEGELLIFIDQAEDWCVFGLLYSNPPKMQLLEEFDELEQAQAYISRITDSELLSQSIKQL